MATYYSNTGNGYQLQLVVAVSSQNIATNQSTITWTLQIDNGSNYYNAKQTGYAALKGTNVWSQTGVTFNSSPSGKIKVIASGSGVYTHENDGTLSIAVAAALRTVTQGYSWSVPQLNLSGTFTAPTIPRFANPPGPPAIYEYDDRTIRLTAPVTTAPGGVSILEYQVRRRDNWKPDAGWTIMGCDANRQCWFTPEKPLTRFDFESRARTSAGWSDWSSSYSTIDSMGMGPQLRYNGVFKDTNAFVKYEGTWVPVIPWVKNSGIWRKVTR